MKRFICLLLAMLLAMGCCAAGEDFFIKTYPLSENGECIVNDVPFLTQPAPDDNERVFYEIFVGSFSDSDGDGIGDLRGIINRMDYLNDGDPDSGLSLGIEGIWLTPVFLSPSYHKYDVTDYYTIDPQFGTMEDLKELIALCHQRDVKLILDLPINHTGKNSRWFKNFVNAHVLNNPGNQYYDFYTWATEGDTLPAGRTFAKEYGTKLLYEANFSDQMPEPDFDNPFVRQTMLDVALHYLEMGIDGFRFDAAKYIYFGDNDASAAFWAWYIGELQAVKPDVYTVAEVWDGEGIIDRYLPTTSCFHFAASQTEGLIAATAKGGDVNGYTATMEHYIQRVRAKGARPTLFISNHDMDRAAGYLTAASGHMKTAASLYLLSPGSPFLYYGEEIGLRGSRGGANTDANRRMAMLWGDGDTVRDPAGTTYTKQSTYTVKDLSRIGDSLYNHYKQLIMLRKANPEIARGEYTALRFADTKLGGFTCTWNGSTVAVLHNTTIRDQTIDLSAATDLPFTVVAGYAGAGKAVLEGSLVTLSGQTSVVLRMDDK